MASLFHGRAPPGFREPVVTPPFVVVLGVGPLFELLNKVLLQQTLDGAVKRARAKPNLAARPFAHFLHDRIAVPVAIGKRHKNMKCVARKSKRPHARNYSRLRYST